MLELSEHPSFPPPGIFAVRDTFVASTAVKIEQLQVHVSRLEREAEDSRALLFELSESVEQHHRYQTFQQHEKRAKETRLDEALRCWKQLKSRIDRIEGKGGAGPGPSTASFPAVEQRLHELLLRQTDLERQLRRQRQYAMVLTAILSAVAAARVLGYA